MRTSKISSVLDEVLKPLGFMRKSRHWSRIGDSISDIIFLDSPRGTSGAMLEFGVLHSSVYKIVWQKSQNHYLDIADSTVRAQPHDLSGSSLDYLWKTESQKDIEEIVSCTVSMVQHFLEKMHSLEAARDWMRELRAVDDHHSIGIGLGAGVGRLVDAPHEAWQGRQDRFGGGSAASGKQERRRRRCFAWCPTRRTDDRRQDSGQLF